MIIEVGKDGSLALRETSNASARKLTEIEFQRALQTAMAAKPEQSFLVRADSSLPYQKVIDVLEAARELGVRKIGLETRSSSGGK